MEPPFAAPLVLPLTSVHLWQIDLTISTELSACLERMLSPGERQHAGTFCFAHDRARFVAVRATLRRLLGGYLALPSERVTIREGIHGKPFVDQTGPKGMRLHFNVSHTDGLALLVFTWGREIGVDVERVRPLPALDEIAERFFAPAERAALAALPAYQRLHGFFACWTRKEAYLKAQGAGLTLPLDRFVVSVAPHEPACLLAANDEPDAPSRWRLEALAPRPGYLGALAVAGPEWSLEPRGDATTWPA